MISRRGLFALPLALPFIPLAVKADMPTEHFEVPQWWCNEDDLTRDTGVFRLGLYQELRPWGISEEEAGEMGITWFKSAEVVRENGVVNIFFPQKFQRKGAGVLQSLLPSSL